MHCTFITVRSIMSDNAGIKFHAMTVTVTATGSF